MSRRIVAAIVGITTLAVTAFGVPLGITVANLYRDEAISQLQRDANRGVAEVSVPPSPTDQPELPAPTDGAILAIYDAGGRRIAGVGPDAADDAVTSAVKGSVTRDSVGGMLVVATPVASDENLVAVVRAARPESSITNRVHRAWLAMSALAGMIVLAAAALARWQARRLSRPVADLAASATRLGDGDFNVRTPNSGIKELDAAGAALDTTADRLGDLLQRERAFSAHASHQLRTPVTGLRIQLETAAMEGGPDVGAVVSDALQSVEQLEHTIDDLIALGRHTDPDRGTVDIDDVFDGIRQRWHGPLAQQGRVLRTVATERTGNVSASAAAVRQIVEVLVANAAEHGAGTVTVTARDAGGATAIDVTDEGAGIATTRDVFSAHPNGDTSRGIGLGLARALAATEGGRLVLASRSQPTTFRLLMPDGTDD
jgi:signal transduction histidine kinase